ncbi:MAG: hypothetical protein ACFE8A_04225 [Candidatus Hodarchaeota archaeon]
MSCSIIGSPRSLIGVKPAAIKISSGLTTSASKYPILLIIIQLNYNCLNLSVNSANPFLNKKIFIIWDNLQT